MATEGWPLGVGGYLGCPNCCDELPDGAVKHLAGKRKSLQCTNLERCDHLTDAAVKHLSEKHQSLHSVNCTWCEQLTDEVVKHLEEKCPSVQGVDFTWCDKLPDEAVGYLAEKRPRLQNGASRAAASSRTRREVPERSERELRGMP